MKRSLLALLLALVLLCSACGGEATAPLTVSTTTEATAVSTEGKITVSPGTQALLPDGTAAYTVRNNNIPNFAEGDKITVSYEQYAPLDNLGRCGTAMACIGRDLMPTEDRGSIGQVKPSGWHTVKYDCVDGKYLYNRCHLIGYQLTGENANVSNLITGTRFLNMQGMLPFEDMVADYVRDTGNHVLYRVTPVFEGGNLLASGVVMEALSVEDDGAGICFHIYAYNIQPGVTIDYATGESTLAEGASTTISPAGTTAADTATYILNVNTKKFHLPTCGQAEDIKPANRREVTESREALIADGYSPCKGCNP